MTGGDAALPPAPPAISKPPSSQKSAYVQTETVKSVGSGIFIGEGKVGREQE